MYRSRSRFKEYSDNLRTVLMFSLSGLTISLTVMERAGQISADYVTNLLWLF
jgi:hypothetical protein